MEPSYPTSRPQCFPQSPPPSAAHSKAHVGDPVPGSHSVLFKAHTQNFSAEVPVMYPGFL
eukprot:scaffold54511_cov20-Tisochrysis_lutea.AAC.1